MQNKPLNKPLEYYKVELEVLAPIKIVYRVLAESPEKALELCEKTGQVTEIKPFIQRKVKNIKATIYRFGYSMIELTKYF